MSPTRLRARAPRSALALPLLVLLPLAAALRAQENPYLAAVDEGRKLYFERKYEAALGHFVKARQIYPRDWRGHTWQAFTLLQMAIEETDPRRRAGLIDEAEAMTGAPLLKQAGLLWQDPLRYYLLGMIAALRGDHARAFDALAKARTARPDLFHPYAAELDLKQIVDTAYARTCMDIGKSMIVEGKWPEADEILQQAYRIFVEYGRMEDTAMKELRRHLAVVDESLGRFDRAIEHLRTCIDLNADNPELQTEFKATIAMIYMANERLEEGIAALDKLPADCTHPEYIAARAKAFHKLAEDGLDPAKVATALAYYRKAMAVYPKEDVYRLVIDYVKLLKETVSAANRDAKRPELEEAIGMLEREKDIRPECPDIYWSIYQIFLLMGEEEKALAAQRLYERKKEEYKNVARFDARGRPRCNSGG